MTNTEFEHLAVKQNKAAQKLLILVMINRCHPFVLANTFLGQ